MTTLKSGQHQDIPESVADSITNVKNNQEERRYQINEFLTSEQIEGFFSRHSRSEWVNTGLMSFVSNL